MHDNTIGQGAIDIGILINRGYYDELLKGFSDKDAMRKMSPVLEFSNEIFIEDIRGIGVDKTDYEGKKEQMLNKDVNYWYRPGKLFKDEIRIFFMEKPTSDMYLTIVDL